MHYKLSVVQKSECAHWRTLHQDISLIIVFFWLYNRPSFLIQPRFDWRFFATVCVPLTSDILCILELIQFLYAFFIRNSEVSMRLNVSILKVYSHKTFFLLCIYYPWNIPTCTAKTTLDVNNSLCFCMMWRSYCRRFVAC